MWTILIIVAGHILLGWNPATWGGWAVFLFIVAILELVLIRVGEAIEKNKKG